MHAEQLTKMSLFHLTTWIILRLPRSLPNTDNNVNPAPPLKIQRLNSFQLQETSPLTRGCACLDIDGGVACRLLLPFIRLLFDSTFQHLLRSCKFKQVQDWQTLHSCKLIYISCLRLHHCHIRCITYCLTSVLYFLSTLPFAPTAWWCRSDQTPKPSPIPS